MPPFSRLKMTWLATPIILVGLLACAGARAQDDSVSYPVAPGTITMQDVLKVHQAQQKQLSIQPPVPGPAPAAAAPLLSPSSQESSQGVMMMQGLKTVLQQSGASTAPTLKPPVIKASTSNPGLDAALPPPTSSPAVASNGLPFQPGQAPKNLATAAPSATASDGSSTTTTTVTTTTSTPGSAPSLETATDLPLPTPSPTASTSATPAPASDMANSSSASTAAASASASSDGCEPHVSTWTKTCADAGYPPNFTGQIKGETRTACPNGALQDVWVSNTCAAPDGDESNAPLTAPTSSPANAQTTSSGATTMSGAGGATATGSASVPAVMSDTGDANCGPANGLASDMRPAADLCNAGSPTDVTGDGPWRWSCRGTGTGMTVSCAAPATPRTTAPPASATPLVAEAAPLPVTEDGLCGISNNVPASEAPQTNLCVKGVASHVSGDGPWNWACSGMNGGQAAACTASRKTDGACGGANAAPTNEMPMSDLCNAGFASAVTGTGPWNWTCSGLYGGQAATCSAAPKQDAVCGNATLTGHREAPQANLCSVGLASSVNGNGPWSWTCSGANGGSPVACEAPASINGTCGSSNGVATSEAPSDNLCFHGRPTRVTGVGPWQWNCSGSENGDTESCEAPRASEHVDAAAAPAETSAATTASASPSSTSTTTGPNLCGDASELAALGAPESDLCKSGAKSAGVTGNGPWSWTCADSAGRTSSCATLTPEGALTSASPSPSSPSSPSNDAASIMVAPKASPSMPVMAVEEKATCGAASSQASIHEPSENLCAVGKPSKLHGEGPWDWTCTKGKTKATCQAIRVVDGACGAANGSMQKAAPANGLCASGAPTDIQGTGPWLWTCVGNGGGASSSCSATAQSQARVDGSCGAASNVTTSNAPSVNLCDTGVASNVYGEGPWTWTCSGLNGGIASSCNAQRNIPPAPPPPGPPVNGLCGMANGVAMVVQPMDSLCTSGTTTSVSGQGPWNWNCLGENGGMTVSCTAPLQPPAPVTGSCGAASGQPTLTPPRSALCAAGITSAVSGQGPWTWSCSGTNGGGAVGCVAPLAGTGNVGSLPSLVTAPTYPTEAPAPTASPAVPVHSSGLVTPKLPSGPLPPLETGSLPQLTPSKAFDTPPEASAMPPVPEPGMDSLQAPSSSPDLPAGTTALQPPALRDSIPPSAALKPGVDSQGNLMAGNHFQLDADVSTITFQGAQENFDLPNAQALDKLVSVLQTNGGVRVTLIAYAATNSAVSPREARRLSLTRALTIRDYLTAKGISSARIDVRALGANVPSGDPDRVDIRAN